MLHVSCRLLRVNLFHALFSVTADIRLSSGKKKKEKKEQQRSMNRKHQQAQPAELHHRQLQTVQQRMLSKKPKNNPAHICNTSVSSCSEFILVQLVSSSCTFCDRGDFNASEGQPYGDVWAKLCNMAAVKQE